MLEFRVLGPFEVRRDGRPIELRGTKRRAVLALLVLQANEVVRTERLIDDLWGEHQPGNASAALHNHVSRLRKDLGEDVLVTRPWGYVLRAPSQAVDLRRFESLVDEARPLPARERNAKLGEALALWRGPALADLVPEVSLAVERARLDEFRQSVVEQQIDARLELGERTEVIPELERLIAEHPLRERLRGQLILALYRSGRQADALETYRETRRVLVEELGIEPSPELRELERAILRQDPALASAGAPAEPEPGSHRVEPPQSRWRWPRSPLMVGAVLLVSLAGGAAAILATPRGGTPHASAAKPPSSKASKPASASAAEPLVVEKSYRRHKPLPARKPPRPRTPPPAAASGSSAATTMPERSKPSTTTTQRTRDEIPVVKPRPKPKPKPKPPPPPPPPPAMTRMADTFDDNTISTELWLPSVSGSGTAVTEQNRRLEMSFAADAAAEPNNQGFSLMSAQVGTECRFLGDFDVSVSYVLVDWPESNGVLLQLAAWFRSSAIAIGRQSQRSGWSEFYTTWNGTSGTSSATLDRRGTLRLKRAGSQLASYIRVKGRWVRLWSFESSGAPTIGLQVMSTDEWFADQPVSVAFDNFEIKAAQPAC